MTPVMSLVGFTVRARNQSRHTCHFRLSAARLKQQDQRRRVPIDAEQIRAVKPDFDLIVMKHTGHYPKTC
jgi:hypothetical protein